MLMPALQVWGAGTLSRRGGSFFEDKIVFLPVSGRSRRKTVEGR